MQVDEPHRTGERGNGISNTLVHRRAGANFLLPPLQGCDVPLEHGTETRGALGRVGWFVFHAQRERRLSGFVPG